MMLKKQTLAMAISLALMGSLTACSGGSNHSTPASSAKPEVKQPAGSAAAKKNAETGSETNAKANETKVSEKKEEAATEKAKTEASQPAVTEKEKAETNKAETEKANTAAKDQAKSTIDLDGFTREQLETIMDPDGKIKWRQLVSLVPSSDSWPNNPLRDVTNGKMSPQMGAAAFANGDSRYKDGDKVKDFRKAEDRASTDYDPTFMTKADIDPNRLQHQPIKNTKGETVANYHFVNQQFSSYTSWKSEEVPMSYGYPLDKRMSGYVATPTRNDIDLASMKGKATYTGHTLGQVAPNSKEVHLGDIQLEADFDAMKISGKLTNRNDVLLDDAVKFNSNILDKYTDDKADLEDDASLTLVSEAELAQKFEEEKKRYRQVDVVINPADIKKENDVVSFYKGNYALSYTDENGKKRETGVLGGIFAGPKAEEVVGEIQGGQNFISFGAREVAK